MISFWMNLLQKKFSMIFFRTSRIVPTHKKSAPSLAFSTHFSPGKLEHAVNKSKFQDRFNMYLFDNVSQSITPTAYDGECRYKLPHPNTPSYHVRLLKRHRVVRRDACWARRYATSMSEMLQLPLEKFVANFCVPHFIWFSISLVGNLPKFWTRFSASRSISRSCKQFLIKFLNFRTKLFQFPCVSWCEDDELNFKHHACPNHPSTTEKCNYFEWNSIYFGFFEGAQEIKHWTCR